MIFSRTAAALVAAALLELYPDVELRGPQETSFGFSYHFSFPHPINEETSSQIEEKMRQIVREKRPIRTLEMVPISARGLLLKEGHRARARELEERKGLVQLAEIGSFYDLVDGPLLKNSSEVGAFKILSLGKRGKELCIVGAARQSKQELKEFLRKWRDYPKTRHEVLGEKQGLWRVLEEGIIWLDAGLKARQKLIDFLKQHIQVKWIESPPGSHRAKIYQTFREPVGELIVDLSPYYPEKGLFEGGRQLCLQIALNSEAAAKSLLQTIRKTLMMLGFSSEEKDGLGRLWALASPGRLSEEVWTVSIPVERNLALLVEKGLCKGTIFEN